MKSQGKFAPVQLIKNQLCATGQDLDAPRQPLALAKAARLDPPGGLARDFPVPPAPTPFMISGQPEGRQ